MHLEGALAGIQPTPADVAPLNATLVTAGGHHTYPCALPGPPEHRKMCICANLTAQNQGSVMCAMQQGAAAGKDGAEWKRAFGELALDAARKLRVTTGAD